MAGAVAEPKFDVFKVAPRPHRHLGIVASVPNDNAVRRHHVARIESPRARDTTNVINHPAGRLATNEQ